MEVHRVIIVGLGLMGGSLARALSGQAFPIFGVDRDLATRQAALDAGVVSAVADELAAVDIRPNDLIVLATPVRTILAQLAALPAVAPHGCMVLDLGSTKAAICAAMNTLPEHFAAIGGHPMCGREVGGFGNSSAELLRDQTFILTPTERTTPQLLQIAHTLIDTVGAHAVVMNSAEHDAMTATVSHVPYVVATVLMALAANKAANTPQLWHIAASGFRDASRLAGSEPQMMHDILITNRDAVTAQLRDYRDHLDTLLMLFDNETGLLDWQRRQQASYRQYRSQAKV